MDNYILNSLKAENDLSEQFKFDIMTTSDVKAMKSENAGFEHDNLAFNGSDLVEESEIEFVNNTMKDEYDPSDNENNGTDHYPDLANEINNEFVHNSHEIIVPDDLRVSGEELEENYSENLERLKETVEHICGKCFKTFRRLKGFKKHLEFCRLDGDYQIRKQDMQKNIDKIEKDSITMETKNICFCCGESYNTCHRGHIKCPKCAKSFKNQLSYERHLFITHAEEPNFPCATCNAEMRTRKLLELHEDQHKSRGKPAVCKTCGREFNRPYFLRHHLKTTPCSNKPSETANCYVCGKVFYDLDYLKVHLEQHLGEQNTKKAEHKCPICKSCFCSPSALNIHIRTHTGEKPFDCDLCEKKFSVLAALKKHRRYHTGEKPYICSVCNKAFAVKEVLNRHMKRHTGDKKHICDECGKSFIQATQLRNHIKSHIRPFSCDLCEESFKTQKSLERHSKSHGRLRSVYLNHSDDPIAITAKSRGSSIIQDAATRKGQKCRDRSGDINLIKIIPRPRTSSRGRKSKITKNVFS